MLTLTLDRYVYEHACEVGIRRMVADLGLRDGPTYDRARMEPEQVASTAAAIAEKAVAWHLGLDWSAGYAWSARDLPRYRDIPDVSGPGVNIEVRRVKHPFGAAVVRAKDLGRGLLLYVAHPRPPTLQVVDLLGWLPVEEAWEQGEPTTYCDPETARQVPVGLLRPCSCLTNGRAHRGIARPMA